MSHAAWSAVTPYLESTRRVIAFDIAGFGSTPALPGGTPPTIPNLVDGLAESIRELGLEIPVDLAGNSLGGTMALEAATRGIARTVVAISPACLWRKHGAAHVPIVFQGLRVMAAHFPGLLKTVVRNPLLRELALAVPISVGSRRMHVDDACRAVDDLTRATAFEATFDSDSLALFRTRHRGSGDRGVRRSRLDPDQGLPTQERAPDSCQMGRETRMGPFPDVGRSGRRRRVDSGRDASRLSGKRGQTQV